MYGFVLMDSASNLTLNNKETAPKGRFSLFLSVTNRYSQLCFVSHWSVLCSTWTYDLQAAKHSFTCKNAVV